MPAPRNFLFGSFRLDMQLHRLFEGDRVVHLKPKEWELLCFLLEQRTRLVTKEELLDALWPRQEVTEANLTQTVYRVRQALKDTARRACWIETVPRIGYRFAGEARETSEGEVDIWPHSLAVLPFADLEAPHSPGDWSLGLADSLIHALDGDPRRRVRRLDAVLGHHEGQAAEVGLELGVEAIIEGKLERHAEGMRIEASLLETASGQCRWTRTWTFDAGDRAAAQLRIVRDVCNQLRESDGTGWRVVDTPALPVPLKAHAAYLQGRYCWHRFTEPALRRSIELFDQAIALAPRYAAAHAWRSAAWSALGNIGALTPRDSAESARRAADQAIAIDDSLAAGFEMLGVVQLYFDRNFDAAMRSFDLAIERDPQSANAHHLRANALAFAGSFGPALRSMERALQLDPTSLITLTDAGVIPYLAGRHEEARERLEQALSQNPHFIHARLKLAFVLAALGRFEDAVAETELAAGELGTGCFGERACFLGMAGQVAMAREIREQLSAGAGSAAVDPYVLALASLGIGEVETCLDWLDRAVEYGSRQLVQLAVDPLWRPLHQQPRYLALVHRIGFCPSQ